MVKDADIKERLARDAGRLNAAVPEARHQRILAALAEAEMPKRGAVAPEKELRAVRLPVRRAWVRAAAAVAACVLLMAVAISHYSTYFQTEETPLKSPPVVPVVVVRDEVPEEPLPLIRPASVVSFVSYPYPVRMQPPREARVVRMTDAVDAEEGAVELAKLIPCQDTVTVLVDIFRPASWTREETTTRQY